MATGPRIVNKLPQFITARQRDAYTGITKALIVGASHASLYTPIKTSNLLNSQYRHVQQDGTRVVGSVGYTADYAQHVHDPDVHQVFHRATAKKEFLRLGFEDSRSMIDRILKQAMKPKS